MRILPVVLTAAFFLSLGACATTPAEPEATVTNGSCIISAHTLTNDQSTRVRIGGKTFHVFRNRITWDDGGSLPLPPSLGLLEITESPTSIAINIDGVKATDVAK